MAQNDATTIEALEKDILKICQGSEAGLTDAEVRVELKGTYEPQMRLEAYNRLLSRGRLRVAERLADGSSKGPSRRVVVYKWVSLKEAQRLAGLTAPERMAYDFIAKAGAEGQTRKDIRSKGNIQNTLELKGIIERLTARGLIKEIKSVKNKKVYILAELDASESHTGGPWYGDDQQLDQEFIGAVYEFTKMFMEGKEFVSLTDIVKHVSESGISNEKLSEDDMRKLLRTMEYDSQIERCSGDGDGDYYRMCKPIPVTLSHAWQPCCVCPVAADCKPGGVISPSTCVYMDDWLESAVLDW